MSVASQLRAIRLRLEELRGGGGVVPVPRTDFEPVEPAPQVAAVNQLRNGDLSHSVRTWNSGAAGDQDLECAHFFTNDAPSTGQQLFETTAATSSTNQTLKSSTHSTYNSAYCDWDRTNGIGRLEGTKTLDAPLPSNTARPNTGLMCVGLRAARRNSSIALASSCRIYAGIWDNTAGQRDWLKANSAFALTATPRGTPGASVERRYKVLLYTDRGYTYLSSEATVASAPADGSYSSTVDVYLTWRAIPGILEAHVYMFVPSTGTYRLLEKTSGSSYADNGTFQNVTVTAYPTATDDRAKAYVATETDALTDLAVDGVDSEWDTIFLNIPIPYNYNVGVTTDKQWLRIGLSVAPTGGDHGVLVDLVHVSYVPGATYAPHPEDLNRSMQPAAAPNGSSQGGVGSGGGTDPGGGGVSCVEVSTPIAIYEGERECTVPFIGVRQGAMVVSTELRANRVTKIRRASCPSLVYLRTENGVELLCSPSHRVITGRNDRNGRAVERLCKGDFVLTYLDGRVERSRVAEIRDTGQPGEVGTFSLEPAHVYVAGRQRRRFFRRRARVAGVLAHNLKMLDNAS